MANPPSLQTEATMLLLTLVPLTSLSSMVLPPLALLVLLYVLMHLTMLLNVLAIPLPCSLHITVVIQLTLQLAAISNSICHPVLERLPLLLSPMQVPHQHLSSMILMLLPILHLKSNMLVVIL